MVEKKKDKKPSAPRAAKTVAAKGRAPKRAPAREAAAAPAAAEAKPSRPRRGAASKAQGRPERAAPAKRTEPRRPAASGVHDLRPAPGATHARKRVGRGPGSGHGKTSGRGHKGQRSRSGYRHLRGFEGGQMPLHRRVPKRGFTNIFRIEYDVVNLRDLDRFDAGATVNPDALREQRLAGSRRPVKILGDGELSKPLQVSAHKFSASARARIEAAGGRCEVLPR
jgi:large subunit ribosomal protein L15